MAELAERAHVVISGTVQGVGFRVWVVRKAVSLNLNGWVRNLAGGEVEAVFEGEEAQVRAMIEACREGPVMARVVEVKVEFSGASGEFKDFSVVR